MGLGPNKTSLLPRVKVIGLDEMVDSDGWMREFQVTRSVARSFSQLKRREAVAKVKKPKLPKPRKHKNHCYCIPRHLLDEPLCCRCRNEKCLKPKKPKKNVSI